MSKKTVTSALAGSALALGLVIAGSAHAALLYNFSGSDEGGTGTATMLFGVDDTTLTVTINNTSPTSLDSGKTNTDNSTFNIAAITGFGFNLDPDSLTLESWNLTAFDIEGDAFETTNWLMETFIAGIELDYLPQTDTPTVDEALYNPDLLSLDPRPDFGGNTPLFTTATLTMVFNEMPTLNASDQWSPFVRMQRVGIDAEGSLRLPGTPGNGGDDDLEQIPEPATIVLLGAGLLGLVGIRRRLRGLNHSA